MLRVEVLGGSGNEQHSCFNVFARAKQEARQQQAWHPEKAADEEDTYDASSLQLQEMTDTWDVAMRNAHAYSMRLSSACRKLRNLLLLPKP